LSTIFRGNFKTGAFLGGMKKKELTAPLAAITFNQMVECSTKLDGIFAALSDATRRGILEHLSREQATVTALARPYRMSLAAVSKHVQVLERAGLIIRSRQGREHWFRADPRPVRQARDWCAFYADAWAQQFDALDAFLQRTKQTNPAPGDPDKNTKEEK
jgi:DNA-binding transcriptional ArsR family regulator